MRTFFVAFAGLTLLSCTAAQAHVDITVDKNNQMMTVAVDGVQRYHWPVSTGAPSYETPSGTFQAMSPLFKSMAVSTAYGGELSGIPRRVISSAPRANMFE